MVAYVLIGVAAVVFVIAVALLSFGSRRQAEQKPTVARWGTSLGFDPSQSIDDIAQTWQYGVGSSVADFIAADGSEGNYGGYSAYAMRINADVIIAMTRPTASDVCLEIRPVPTLGSPTSTVSLSPISGADLSSSGSSGSNRSHSDLSGSGISSVDGERSLSSQGARLTGQTGTVTIDDISTIARGGNSESLRGNAIVGDISGVLDGTASLSKPALPGESPVGLGGVELGGVELGGVGQLVQSTDLQVYSSDVDATLRAIDDRLVRLLDNHPKNLTLAWVEGQWAAAVIPLVSDTSAGQLSIDEHIETQLPEVLSWLARLSQLLRVLPPTRQDEALLAFASPTSLRPQGTDTAYGGEFDVDSLMNPEVEDSSLFRSNLPEESVVPATSWLSEEPAKEEPLGVEDVAGEETVGVEDVAGEETVGVEDVAREEPLGVEDVAGEETVGVEDVAGEETVGVEDVAGEETVGVEDVTQGAMLVEELPQEDLLTPLSEPQVLDPGFYSSVELGSESLVESDLDSDTLVSEPNAVELNHNVNSSARDQTGEPSTENVGGDPGLDGTEIVSSSAVGIEDVTSGAATDSEPIAEEPGVLPPKIDEESSDLGEVDVEAVPFEDIAYQQGTDDKPEHTRIENAPEASRLKADIEEDGNDEGGQILEFKPRVKRKFVVEASAKFENPQNGGHDKQSDDSDTSHGSNTQLDFEASSDLNDDTHDSAGSNVNRIPPQRPQDFLEVPSVGLRPTRSVSIPGEGIAAKLGETSAIPALGEKESTRPRVPLVKDVDGADEDQLTGKHRRAGIGGRPGHIPRLEVNVVHDVPDGNPDLEETTILWLPPELLREHNLGD